MKFVAVSLVAALLIAGCSKPATTTTASTTTASTTATTAAASFTVNDLGNDDVTIQGCTRTMSRTHAAPGNNGIFAEDGVDNGAVGFIKIDGTLIHVALISSNATEKGGTRTFADKANTVQIVETLVTGEAHEEADSVEENGSLSVTYHGSTQTIEIEGGTAC